MGKFLSLVQNAYEGPSHTREYRILNHDLKKQECKFEVQATEAEIDQIAKQGFLVRPKLFRGEALEMLRRTVDEIETRERARGEAKNTDARRYGGVFLRDLIDKDSLFLDYVRTAALLSVARALLGPRIEAALGCRISMPGEENQETHWHFHQRINMDPPPPFHSPYQKVDCLVYLDDLNDESGSLCVMPQSHLWERRYLPGENFEDMDGQVEIKVPAGSAVIMNTNLWHRGKPNTSRGHRRRVLILGYSLVTMNQIRRSRLPKGGIIEKALEDGDPELVELVGGASGYTEWSGNLP